MLDSDGKPVRIIFRPSRELDKIIDKKMSSGRWNTKSALIMELIWNGLNDNK